MPSDGDSGRPAVRRLHPISLLFSIGKAARNLLLPGIVILWASGGSNTEVWLMIFFVPAVLAALIKYWSYRYRLEGDELIVREGIVTRNERHIPYARIQNVDLVQNPVHRLFRVAEVRLETAGGQAPEAVIRVLSLEAIERMRSRIFGGRRATADRDGAAVERGTPEESPARLLHYLPPRDVLLYGIISNKGMVVVAAALGAAWQFDLFERWGSWISPDLLERIPEFKPQQDPLSAVLLGLAALVAALILMRLLSIAWAFVKLYGFRLRRRGDDLAAEYGLFTRVSKTIPRRRIQVLSAVEGPLHRWFGRVSVQVETAGRSEESEGDGADRQWLAPLARKDQVAALFREALTELDPDAVRWQPISSRARARLVRYWAYVLLPIVAVCVWQLGRWGLIPAALLLAFASINVRLYVKHAAYSLIPGAVFYRSGWWTRRMSVARFSKIQSVRMTESPFDRRHGMASLSVDTAGGGHLGHKVAVSYLDAPVAAELLDRLAHEAGRTAFRW